MGECAIFQIIFGLSLWVGVYVRKYNSWGIGLEIPFVNIFINLKRKTKDNNWIEVWFEK